VGLPWVRPPQVSFPADAGSSLGSTSPGWHEIGTLGPRCVGDIAPGTTGWRRVTRGSCLVVRTYTACVVPLSLRWHRYVVCGAGPSPRPMPIPPRHVHKVVRRPPVGACASTSKDGTWRRGGLPGSQTDTRSPARPCGILYSLASAGVRTDSATAAAPARSTARRVPAGAAGAAEHRVGVPAERAGVRTHTRAASVAEVEATELIVWCRVS
jgi:hypothetical protein